MMVENVQAIAMRNAHVSPSFSNPLLRLIDGMFPKLRMPDRRSVAIT